MIKSNIATVGLIQILNEMKNPLTNIRLCIDMIEKDEIENDGKSCYDIIKKSAEKLETSIRDLVSSFEQLGIRLHIPPDTSSITL